MNKSYLLSLCLYSISSLFNTSSATVIDFETVPGGTPSDQLAISTQYLADYGVTFSVERSDMDTAPCLEQTGTDMGEGFWNATGVTGTFDTEAVGYQGELGSYFF